MCGFIAYINKNSLNESFYEKKFNYFHDNLKYRGPNFQTKFKDQIKGNIINCGFSRLSIQDLSNRANKIFKNENSILLFNGEIYNFNDLKKNYLDNEKFETNTDTEVLFLLLNKYGITFIDKLEGIFSFAFFDLKKNKLYLARDYTGTKPLYYSINKSVVSFSSEAWFLYSLSNKELNLESMSYYFSYGFSPTHHTLIQNVKKVRPGYFIKINLENFYYNESKYFSIKFEDKVSYDTNNLKKDIESCIKKNLISDVKTGVFLSGGLDSSIISIIAKRYNSSIQCFTSCFYPKKKYEKFNEDLIYAKKLAQKFNIKLNEVYLDTENKNQRDDIYKSYKKLDEPLPNFNFFNSYLQAKYAKEIGCKVILTGDGSDEIFGGYERYKNALIAKKFKFLSFLNNNIKTFNQLKNEQVINFFYNKKINNFFFSKKFSKILHNFHFDDFLPNASKEELINYFDLFYWLPEESNMKLDRSCMFNSIEGRIPFQDITLIKKYFPISLSKKINFFEEKIFLKKELDFIPKFIKKRKKIGWLSPESFFIRDYFKETINDVLNDKDLNSQQIFNDKKILSILDEHRRGKYFKNEIITIFAFQVWYNELLKV